MEEEVSLRTHGRSVIFYHRESKARILVKLVFVFREMQSSLEPIMSSFQPASWSIQRCEQFPIRPTVMTWLYQTAAFCSCAWKFPWKVIISARTQRCLHQNCKTFRRMLTVSPLMPENLIRSDLLTQKLFIYKPYTMCFNWLTDITFQINLVDNRA